MQFTGGRSMRDQGDIKRCVFFNEAPSASRIDKPPTLWAVQLALQRHPSNQCHCLDDLGKGKDIPLTPPLHRRCPAGTRALLQGDQCPLSLIRPEHLLAVKRNRKVVRSRDETPYSSVPLRKLFARDEICKRPPSTVRGKQTTETGGET